MGGRRNLMMVSARWRNSAVVAASIALSFALVACGAEQFDPNADGGSTSPTAEPSGTPTTGDSPMSTPLTLTRTGGFAGFHDTLTVQPDGTAKLVTRGKSKPVTCTVEPAVFEKLNKSLQAVDIASMPSGFRSTRPPIADEIYLTLTIGDKNVRYQSLGTGNESLRQVFQTMSDILNTAFALQNGGSGGKDTGACTA